MNTKQTSRPLQGYKRCEEKRWFQTITPFLRLYRPSPSHWRLCSGSERWQ